MGYINGGGLPQDPETPTPVVPELDDLASNPPSHSNLLEPDSDTAPTFLVVLLLLSSLRLGSSLEG